jgi:hypothetical protein
MRVFHLLLPIVSVLFVTKSIAQIPELVLPEMTEGETMVYFDSLLRPVNKEKSVFYMHTYFHLGKDVWSIRQPWRDSKNNMEWVGVLPGSPGNPAALHGTVKWMNRNYSRLIAQEQFVNGRFAGQTTIYNRRQQAIIVYDYDKKWNGELWSLYYQRFHKAKLEKAAYEVYSLEKCRWATICTEGCYVSKDFRP